MGGDTDRRPGPITISHHGRRLGAAGAHGAARHGAAGRRAVRVRHAGRCGARLAPAQECRGSPRPGVCPPADAEHLRRRYLRPRAAPRPRPTRCASTPRRPWTSPTDSPRTSAACAGPAAAGPGAARRPAPVRGRRQSPGRGSERSCCPSPQAATTTRCWPPSRPRRRVISSQRQARAGVPVTAHRHAHRRQRRDRRRSGRPPLSFPSAGWDHF